MTGESAVSIEAGGRGAPGRILVVLLGAIGDVVRALPLLGRIRRAWPQTYIAWAVESKSEPILRGHEWLDELIVYRREHAPWSFVPFLYRIRAAQFDLVVDLQRHLKSGIISRVSGAEQRLGFAAANTKEFNHYFSTRQIEPQPRMRLKLTQYQAFGDTLGLPSGPIEFGLRLPAEEARRARAVLANVAHPVIGIILGSSWPSRIYPPEAMAEVIRRLATSVDNSPTLFPLLLGGRDEVALAGRVMHLLDKVPALNLSGRTGLRDLVAIFADCAVALGPDCGPMHIAAAVGCPVISLWGSTAPERSAPWGFAELAIQAQIGCHPCYLRKCPIDGECMRRIAPATVADTVMRALRMYPPSPKVGPSSVTAERA